nr:ferric enterobactin transport ATP-binding protein FepC [Raoultella sp. NCTC 9187]
MRATGITDLRSRALTRSPAPAPARVDCDGAGAGNRHHAARRTDDLAWISAIRSISLELLSELNREKGYTLAAVLHDLNQACRYATHLIALRDGKIIAEGAPKEIVTAELIERDLRPCAVPSSTTRSPTRRWWYRWAAR